MTPEQEDEALREWPTAEVCRLLAARVRRARIERRESQAAFAARCSVPLRTYKRFEADGSGTLETFVQILRALDRTRYLLYLFPQALPPRPPTLDDKIRHINNRVLLNRVRSSDEPISVIASKLADDPGDDS